MNSELDSSVWRTNAAGITIRPVQPNDVSALYQIMTHPAVARQLSHMPTMEISEFGAPLAEGQLQRQRLVAEKDGRVHGFGELSSVGRPRLWHSASLTLAMRPEGWRREVATSLLTALIDLADNWMRLIRLEIAVYDDHETAIRLLKKFGFAAEGRRRMVAFGYGQWRDDLVMSRILPGFPYEPSPREETLEERPRQATNIAEIKVRPALSEDTEEIYKFSRHPLVARTTLQLPSMERLEVSSRLSTLDPHRHRFVAEADGTVCGSGNMRQGSAPRLVHRGRLGMSVHPEYWGAGIGSVLMDKLMDLADNWLNLRRVELEVNTDNPAAVRLYEKFGFQIEGVKRAHNFGDGRWVDSYFMGRIKG